MLAELPVKSGLRSYGGLQSMVNHFVDDEHFCFFDDMYSPEYSLQWIYENIMKYFKVNAIRIMAIQHTSN